MSPTTIKALYLAAWAGVLAVMIYLLTAAGYSFWVAAALAYAIFFLANGTLAYRVRARQLRAQGEQPPPFLVYLFFPNPLGLRQKVRVPRPLRVLVGVIFLAGGVMFIAIDAMLLADFSKLAHPVGAVALILALFALGSLIAFVGWRLLVVKGEDPLFKRANANQANVDAG